jgi:cyanophycin synthetase
VAAALKSFSPEEHNLGRTNLYGVGGGYVLLDYGHNPGALESVCRLASQWRGRRVTAVVGVPGDRCDELIEEAGRIAAHGFSRIVIKEDEDLRGREPGEVAHILLRAIKEEKPERECQIVLDEREAVRKEVDNIRLGDILIVFYDKMEPIKRELAARGAHPVSHIEAKITKLNIAKA